MDKDYYKYYEFLFSLRKEYLKNQEIINKLLSYIRITNDSLNEYDSNLVFRKNNKDSTDSLLLIVKKRQSHIKTILDSLYSSLVYSSPDLKPGDFSYSFRLSDKYVYLLDDDQDGRYLKAKIEIVNQNEFIKLYNQLVKNVVCKCGRTYLILEKEFIQLSNNGIYLLHVDKDYKNGVKLNYDGLHDNIITNNISYLENLMELKIKKDTIPNYFENIIDNNMDDYLYTIEENCNMSEGFYTIEDYGRKLVLKPRKDKEIS